jgi:hypothetical protein
MRGPDGSRPDFWSIFVSGSAVWTADLGMVFEGSGIASFSQSSLAIACLHWVLARLEDGEMARSILTIGYGVRDGVADSGGNDGMPTPPSNSDASRKRFKV